MLADFWVLLKVEDKNGIFYKALCSFGNEWKLNSEVQSIEEEKDYYYIFSKSGTEYKCNKNREQLNTLLADVLLVFKEKHIVEVVDTIDNIEIINGK